MSIQEEKKLQDHYVWSFGYRFERSRNWSPDLVQSVTPPFIRVSPFTTTLLRETRDDVLDATQGSFFSQAFSISPLWPGAEGYVKYFGQYFHYFPLQSPRHKPFTNEIIRPRLVFATGVRLGLASGLSGEAVPLSERFFAGGSTTLRGFAQNTIGFDCVPRLVAKRCS